MANEEEPRYDEIGKDIMVFYVNKMLEYRLPEVRTAVINQNPQVDPEYVGEIIDGEINKYVDELAHKMNSTALLVLDYLVTGRVSELRRFETLFTDLLERTLLRSADFMDFLQEVREKLLDFFESKKKNDEYE